jgi:hypothetical protein
MITESNKTFEALKSRYMTGFSSSWRKASPFAAPTAIFSLVNQGKAAEYPASIQTRQEHIYATANGIKETFLVWYFFQ